MRLCRARGAGDDLSLLLDGVLCSGKSAARAIVGATKWPLPQGSDFAQLKRCSTIPPQILHMAL